MVKKWVIILSSILTCAILSAHGIKDDKRTVEIKQILKKEYGFIDPVSGLQAEIDKAFKFCGIDPHGVIVMQNTDTSQYYAGMVSNLFAWRKLHPYAFTSKKIMLITWPNIPFDTRVDEWDRTLFTIYHECGHLVHGDTSWFKALSVFGFAFFANEVLVKLLMPKKSFSQAAGLVGLYWLAYFSYIRQSTHTSERNADKFATQKLIEQKNYMPVIKRLLADLDSAVIISDAKGNTYRADRDYWLENFIREDRPQPLDRAGDMVELLLENRVNIIGLPVEVMQRNSVLRDSLTPKDFKCSEEERDFLNRLLSHVKKNFPDYYAKFHKIHEDMQNNVVSGQPRQEQVTQKKHFINVPYIMGLALGAASIGWNLWDYLKK